MAKYWRKAAERDAATGPVEGCETGYEQNETYVHHNQVVYRRASCRGLLRVEHDEHERTDCHQLPEEQEHVTALLADYGHHGKAHHSQSRVVERKVRCRFFVGIVGQIPARVERYGKGGQRYYYKKQGAEPVDFRHAVKRAARNGAYRRGKGVKRACSDYRGGIMGLVP